jgi:hypothetical protein
MSLQTWIEEFYPIPADVIAATKDELKCVESCIKKWEGLKVENLAKHDVICIIYTLMDKSVDPFIDQSVDTVTVEKFSHFVSSKTCALCLMHGEFTAHKQPTVYCAECILCILRGVPCDNYTNAEYAIATVEAYTKPNSLILTPFGTFIELHDPRPMLDLLYGAKKELTK